jgi:hypothetical protein
MPHSSSNGAPERRSHSAILAAGIVWPPTAHIRSDERSAPPTAGSASIMEYMLGTPSNTVARWRAISASAVAGLKRSSITRVAPAMKVPFMMTLP